MSKIINSRQIETYCKIRKYCLFIIWPIKMRNRQYVCLFKHRYRRPNYSNVPTTKLFQRIDDQIIPTYRRPNYSNVRTTKLFQRTDDQIIPTYRRPNYSNVPTTKLFQRTDDQIIPTYRRPNYSNVLFLHSCFLLTSNSVLGKFAVFPVGINANSEQKYKIRH